MEIVKVTMRLFVALDLSWQSKKEIKKLLSKLFKKHWPVKWVKAGQLHLTLAFLGQLKKEKLKLVNQACRQAVEKIKPFAVSFKGLGCFPGYDWPQVIWLGLKGDLQTLAVLEKKVKQALGQQGFSIDERSFSPHVTLGRIKQAGSGQRKEIGRQLKALRVLDL